MFAGYSPHHHHVDVGYLDAIRLSRLPDARFISDYARWTRVHVGAETS